MLQLARKLQILTEIQLPVSPRHKVQIGNSHLLVPNGEMVQWKSCSEKSFEILYNKTNLNYAETSCNIIKYKMIIVIITRMHYEL